jgi:hypothetical protein
VNPAFIGPAMEESIAHGMECLQVHHTTRINRKYSEYSAHERAWLEVTNRRDG